MGPIEYSDDPLTELYRTNQVEWQNELTKEQWEDERRYSD